MIACCVTGSVTLLLCSRPGKLRIKMSFTTKVTCRARLKPRRAQDRDLERSKTHPGCPIETFNLSCRWRLTRSNLPISRSLVAIAKNLSSNGLFFLPSCLPRFHRGTTPPDRLSSSCIKSEEKLSLGRNCRRIRIRRRKPVCYSIDAIPSDILWRAR